MNLKHYYYNGMIIAVCLEHQWIKRPDLTVTKRPVNHGTANRCYFCHMREVSDEREQSTASRVQ